MQGYNYGLITADEWLNPASDTIEFLREAKAEVLKAVGYQGNSKFFVLVYIPESTMFINWDAIDWSEAPKGEATEIQDVVPKADLERGVLHPVEEALEEGANVAADALDKAAGVGTGLAMLVGVPVGLYFLWQIASALKGKK